MDNDALNRPKLMIILKALILAYVVTGVLLLILALLLYKMELNESQVSIGIIAIYLIASFIGGWTAGKSSGSKKFIWGTIVGVVYFLILALISLVTKHTLEAPSLQMVTTLVLCVGGGLLGGMLS